MIIAVGAHSRNVGKTSIICSILNGTPDAPWVAVKISANRRGVGGGFETFEERKPGADTDSARYLAAGAARAYWLRADDRQMDQAAWFVRRLASSGVHVIVESNRIVEQLSPDLYLLALDFAVADFKDTARRLFHRADAYAVSNMARATPAWDNIPIQGLDRRPIYQLTPPDYRPRGLIRDVRSLLGLSVDRAEVA